MLEAGPLSGDKQPVMFRLRQARPIESRVEPRGEVLRDRLTLLSTYEGLRQKYEMAQQAAKGENTQAVERARSQLMDAERRLAELNG